MWASQGPGVSEDGKWFGENVGESDLEGMNQCSLPAQGGSGLSHQGSVSKIRTPGQIVVDPGA